MAILVSGGRRPNGDGDATLRLMREGVVIVVRREGRFLVIRRADHILAGGCWCFVGGGLEPGEAQEVAVEREFTEEVGGKVRAIRKIWHSEREQKLRLHWWLAELLDDQLVANPHEVAEMRWLTSEEILALPKLLETNDQFLRTVCVDDSVLIIE